MVTCKLDTVAVPKMNSVRSRKPSSSNSSGFRLLDGDQLETASSVSRNSIYKLKIDLMFDDSRSTRSNRLDDPRGSHRTRSIIMYGRSELASTVGESSRSIASILQDSTAAEKANILAEATKKDVRRISNSVQAQIEQLFTDVAKDATSSFAVTCLGSLPLKDKVTSLQGLQEPLRELYLNEIVNQKRNSGFLDICATGLRVKTTASNNSSSNADSSNNNDNDSIITPFHNIAVWSAVKFVVSDDGGGAAFLPLITDPENIDKSSLFQPLSPAELKHVTSSTHAPIFAVVMRSAGVPKLLECHGFICKSTEDAIVIAATLYQSLMAHVNTNSHRSTKRRTPRNQNGVSCVSIASSSAQTGSNYMTRSQLVSGGRRSSFRSSNGSRRLGGSIHGAHGSVGGPGSVSGLPSVAGDSPGTGLALRSGRKKRVSNSSLSSSSNVINEAGETTTEERKRRSHKTKRAPPVPAQTTPELMGGRGGTKGDFCDVYGGDHACGGFGGGRASLAHRGYHHGRKPGLGIDPVYHASELIGGGMAPAVVAAAAASGGGIRSESNGDILTRVAIPRSGSFLNTGGLTRYKSRAARRHSGKLGGGGGGGSPLGFSELFNEFRLHENLHSLDDILYAIIDADGMSFNDLKPIYKEFLLKLAVTLTKDELYQRSKNIMRRQKKKKLKRKSSNSSGSQKKPRTLLFGTKSLKKVFQLGQFRSCRGKPPKPPRNKEASASAAHDERKEHAKDLVIGPPSSSHHHQHQHPRSRVATSGSDVSVVRHENGFGGGPNRNSSSGYVSCSECSYDSEACTCISADRCYCSLRNEQLNKNLGRKNDLNSAMAKKAAKLSPKQQLQQQLQMSSSKQKLQAATTTMAPPKSNRHSLISCRSEDKCYCSLVEEEEDSNNTGRRRRDRDDDEHSQSDTTSWCDSDSCISASKCYCKRDQREQRRSRMAATTTATSTKITATTAGSGASCSDESPSQRRQSRQSGTRKGSTDKLALDYELFTIGGNGKSVQPHEALSVKKSVEAAAIFADVKLSQTTDIKSLRPTTPSSSPSNPATMASRGGSVSRSSTRKSFVNSSYRRRESQSIDRKNERNLLASLASSNSSQKSYSADDLLSKLSAIEEAVGRGASVKSAASGKRRELHQFSLKENFQSTYQSMRAVSASLEDTLGYLP